MALAAGREMTGALVFLLIGTSGAGAQRAHEGHVGNAPIAIVGNWELNLARTHYGPTAERRRHERFFCAEQTGEITCVIKSVRSDGRVLTARFKATVDGIPSAVSGIPDVDQVQVRQPANEFVDATFFSRRRPVFGYRAFQSRDGRSLMIVSVDPVSRIALTTVVVYDRR